MEKVSKLPDPTDSLTTEVCLQLSSNCCACKWYHDSYNERMLMVIWLSLTWWLLANDCIPGIHPPLFQHKTCLSSL